MSTQKPRRAPGGRLMLVAGLVIVLGGVGTFALTRAFGSAGPAEARPTFRVQQGPLTISVVQSGTINSREQVSLKNEVEGQTTLIYLIPEGTAVQEGQLLVELDASQLQDQLVAQQISVDNAEAAFIRAREGLAVAENQAESDISRAVLDYQFAVEDVKQYEEGQYPQEVKEAESNITLAKEEMERANEKLTWSQRLYEEKYISQTELEADALTQKRAELNHELAVASLELLQKYTYPRKLAELTSNVEQTAMALERVKLQANADIVQAKADLKAKETELRQQQAKLAKTQGQLDKTKIYAPRAGLVVYATSVQGGGRRMRNEPLEEGQAVRERQELIYLPSAESMMAEVLIHESSLEKVRVGQPVRVTVDALPGQVYAGRVAKIAPLPDAQSAWLNPDLKVYPTEIHLDGTHPELRTGMSCQAEIIVERFADALYVPVQSVLRRANEPIVFVRDGDGFASHTVEIGLDNNSMVRVIAGLTAGQEVLLTPPLDAGTLLRGAAPEPAPATPETPPVTVAAPAPAAAAPQAAAGPGEAGAGRPGPGFGDMTPEQRAEARRRFESMTPEEREAIMRRRMENMTPEQREEFERRRGQGRAGGGGPGSGGGGGGAGS